MSGVRSVRDRGSASVLALGVVGVVTVLLLAGLLIAAVATAGQQARTAADLAALAAAGRLTSGEGVDVACRLAEQVAKENGADLTGCSAGPRAQGDAGARGAGGAGGAGDYTVPVIEVEVTRLVTGTPWRARAVAAATGVPQRSP